MNWNRLVAAVALFLVAAAWGASFTLVKNVLARIAPEPFIFWRFTAAGVLLLVLALLRRDLCRDVLRPGAILGLLVFAGYAAQTHGLMTISASRSAFITGTYVVMVPFCDRLAYRARISARAWIGSVLAVIGTSLLIGRGIGGAATWGDLLTIFCAVCFAFHVVLSAKFAARQPPIALSAVQVLVVGLAAAPPSFFSPQPRWSPEIVLVILFTAVVTTALAFVALMWGQARVSATEAAVILAFEPVAASITSVLVDHEPVTRRFLGGAAMILTAMIVSQLPGRAPSPQPPA